MLTSVYYSRSHSQSSCIFFQKSQSSKGLLTRETASTGRNVLFFDRNCANEHYEIKDQENLNDNFNPRKAAVQAQGKQPREKKVQSGLWIQIPKPSPPVPGCSIKAESDIRLITEVSQGPLLILDMISGSHHPILMESS